MSGLIITIIVVVILVIWVVAIYNGLVRLRNNRENAFADIDVQLKQRHDLIPQLVNTVKGYMKHEQATLQAITNARQKAVSANTINDKIEAEQEITAAMRGLNVQVEAYPDLKASANFMQLQEEMSDIENKLASVRRYFNSATRELNTSIQKFPNVIFAGMFGFSTQPMFDLGIDQRQQMDQAPEVEF